MNELPINADTVNKTLDIASESTKEIRKEIDKTSAKGIHKLAELFWASPIGIKTDVYIQERPYKMQKAIKEMQKKYDENIPVEYQVEPSSYIALKGINELNYALDEDHLKEMFENILVSDMDSRKKGRVLPAYIEMVKQMSKDDVEFLKLLKEKALLTPLPIIQLKWSTNSGFISMGTKIIINPNNAKELIEINPIVLNNLLRLNIINIPNGIYLISYNSLYKQAFEHIKKENAFDIHIASELSNMTLDFNKEKLEITPLGLEIIDICLS